MTRTKRGNFHWLVGRHLGVHRSGHTARRTNARGTITRGSAGRGSVVRGSAVRGSAIRGTAVQGTTTQGNTVWGIAARGTAARGTAVRGTACEPPPYGPLLEGPHFHWLVGRHLGVHRSGHTARRTTAQGTPAREAMAGVGKRELVRLARGGRRRRTGD
jgi:hypothetical protein